MSGVGEEGPGLTNGPEHQNALLQILADSDKDLENVWEHSNYGPYLQRIIPKTRREVEDEFQDAKLTATFGVEVDCPNSESQYIKKERLIVTAIKLMDSFVPRVQRSRLIDLFYGAVSIMLQPHVSLVWFLHNGKDSLRPQQFYEENYTFWLSTFAERLGEIRTGVATGSWTVSASFGMPISFFHLFQQIVLYACCLDEQETVRSGCQRFLTRAVYELHWAVTVAHAGEIRVKAGPDCEGILAIILNKSLKASSDKDLFDVRGTYHSYIMELVSPQPSLPLHFSAFPRRSKPESYQKQPSLTISKKCSKSLIFFTKWPPNTKTS
jgi:hypothetical protein